MYIVKIVCVCVRARVRACVRVCVCVREEVETLVCGGYNYVAVNFYPHYSHCSLSSVPWLKYVGVSGLLVHLVMHLNKSVLGHSEFFQTETVLTSPLCRGVRHSGVVWCFTLYRPDRGGRLVRQCETVVFVAGAVEI